MRNLLTFTFLSLCLGSCSPFQADLDSLGQASSFDDIEIADDFLPPGQGSSPDLPLPGETLPIPIKPLHKFYFDDHSYSLAHGEALRWDGCHNESSTQGGYNSFENCGSAFFHQLFAENLNEIFLSCVAAAAKAGNLPAPYRVYINHLGSYNDRNSRGSSQLSHHAYARAWDISFFDLYSQTGELHRISTYKRDYHGFTAVFYDTFRLCWKSSLPDTCSKEDREYHGSIGHSDSQLGGNSLHNDHLHLSYPLCAGESV